MRTTTKQVKEQLKNHVLDYFGIYNGWETDNKINNLKEQLKSFDYLPSNYSKGLELVQGGTFLIYYVDIQKFLNDLDINPNNKEYSEQQSWKLYKHLIARTINELVR